ncbi:MAG: IS21 family transposase [Anaerolineales bacterium]|nr:IS21 family transposase [Anaerolineales bacterium]
MITVKDRERIRQAYHVEGKSMRQIAQELKHSYWTIRKALASAEAEKYTLSQPRPAPVLGPYRAEIERLLAEEAKLPPKQRYTSGKIYRLLHEQGYRGSQSGLRRYVGQRRRALKRPKVFIPLEFDPGQDAQVDWGEATVEIASEPVKVQLFVMRLCYSRKTFVMAFPRQKQEAFFAGHVAAFNYFQGVPHTLTYDNLKTAVARILEGRDRQEQESFVTFRSHYLFASRFCRPGTGNDKGSVEHGVGYARRNYLVPPPQVADYDELNAYLLAYCQADDERRVDRQPEMIGAAWEREKAYLRPLPASPFPCCRSREVTLNPYGQVVFETNRYSVPVEKAQSALTLKAYPFHIEVLAGEEVIARHQRCYERQQDLLEPLHYLPLLAQRPGAFEHAKPLRQWRATWPTLYEELLANLRQRLPENKAVRQFIQILQLHQHHEATLVEAAMAQALADQVPHLEGVTFCLQRLSDESPAVAGFWEQKDENVR